MAAQGCTVPPQWSALSPLGVGVPMVGTVTLQHLGHCEGTSAAAQLCVPSAASSHAGELFPVLQSFPEHLTQEANWG